MSRETIWMMSWASIFECPRFVILRYVVVSTNAISSLFPALGLTRKQRKVDFHLCWRLHNWFFKNSNSTLQGLSAQQCRLVGSVPGLRVTLFHQHLFFRKVCNWWQNPKYVFCILSESTAVYTFNVVPVPDKKNALNFGIRGNRVSEKKYTLVECASRIPLWQ